ncbi:hypothetical protein MtrunA17_Chr1g0175631 [Medicago truncatula]|uniref:Transmembrane protein n=1 Tax=Medicago truncatula TaxID=3880 RepID=A0A396JPE6_MEDTR|nr:hypothetical protein MtrunA17_Chr1g0175631 [Medicago truncatula]
MAFLLSICLSYNHVFKVGKLLVDIPFSIPFLYTCLCGWHLCNFVKKQRVKLEFWICFFILSQSQRTLFSFSLCPLPPPTPSCYRRRCLSPCLHPSFDFDSPCITLSLSTLIWSSLSSLFFQI